MTAMRLSNNTSRNAGQLYRRLSTVTLFMPYLFRTYLLTFLSWGSPGSLSYQLHGVPEHNYQQEKCKTCNGQSIQVPDSRIPLGFCQFGLFFRQLWRCRFLRSVGAQIGSCPCKAQLPHPWLPAWLSLTRTWPWMMALVLIPPTLVLSLSTNIHSLLGTSHASRSTFLSWRLKLRALEPYWWFQIKQSMHCAKGLEIMNRLQEAKYWWCFLLATICHSISFIL